jgi:hypothetical protein
MQKPSGARLAIITALILFPFLYFYPAIKKEIVLAMGDSWSYSILLRMLQARMMSEGMIPLWNPYTFAGMPLLAAIQPGVLYPPNWLFLFFSPGVAMNLVVITTYHIALIGTYLYLRTLDCGRAPAFLGALVFTFGGFMISHLEQVNYIAATAYLPWVLFCLQKLKLAGDWRASLQMAAAGAVVIALHSFAGLPQATFQIALICGPYFLLLLFQGRRDGDRRAQWMFLAAVCGMAIAGALLSAVQLAPTRELQLQGERAGIPYESFAIFSMPPRRFLALLTPYFFGGALGPLYHVGGWDHWWLHKYIHGYVGILTLVLGFAAIRLRRAEPIVRFWSVVAVVSLLLCLGDYLPFGIHRILYQIPIYNLFRAPYRHLYEFNFAVAALAGLGLESLGKTEIAGRKRALLGGAAIVTALMGVSLVCYRFFADRMDSLSKPPAAATRLANPEAWVPLLCLVAGLSALWIFTRRPSRLTAAAVLLLLFFDLASFGWYTYWRTSGYALMAKLEDPPAIKAIKQRESDLKSFRILSYAANPYDRNYEDLSHANLAIARGIQSASGYDPMRLSRVASLIGNIDIFGMIPKTGVFDLRHQGLNLLNVKYLLKETEKPASLTAQVTLEGVKFSSTALELELNAGRSEALEAGGATATELVLVTTLADSVMIPDNTPVAKITLWATDQRRFDLEVLAGRDVAEWAYDRPDVAAAIQHRRPKVVESSPADGFDAHRYLARLPFPRAEIKGLDIEYIGPRGLMVVHRASLYDAAAGTSTPLIRATLPARRWRQAGVFGEVELWENLHTLPRAWYVDRVIRSSGAETLRAIEQDKLADGSDFTPLDQALLDAEDVQPDDSTLQQIGKSAEAQVKVVHYEPQRIELLTRNEKPGFMIMSEVFYRGWEARIDGVQVPVRRVDYALRGVRTPPGEHRIEFRFSSPSFRSGALISLCGAGLLIAGVSASLYRTKRKSD